MTAENLAMIVGAIISFILGLAPVIKNWFDSRSSLVKAAIAGGLTILMGTVIYLANCQGWYKIPGLVCSQESIGQWATVVLNALLGLVAVYIPIVRPLKK